MQIVAQAKLADVVLTVSHVDFSKYNMSILDNEHTTSYRFIYQANIKLKTRTNQVAIPTETLRAMQITTIDSDDFANGNVFDVGVGGRAQEPIQLAVRSVIERASLEMMANLYGAPNADVCTLTEGIISTNSVTGDYTPFRAQVQDYNGGSRQSPNKWHEDRDGGFSLRGKTSAQ